QLRPPRHRRRRRRALLGLPGKNTGRHPPPAALTRTFASTRYVDRSQRRHHAGDCYDARLTLRHVRGGAARRSASMTPRNAGRSVLAALAASTSLALAGVVPVDDEIFANGFELPTIACGWNTTLGNPGGSLSTLDLWNGDLYVGGSQAGPFGGVNGGVAQIDLATGTVSPLGTTELVDGF